MLFFAFCDYGNRFGDIKVAILYFFYRSRNACRHENFVHDYRRFVHGAEYVAGLHFISDFFSRFEMPLLFVIDAVDLYAAGNTIAVLFDYFFKRTLNAVENTADKTGSKLDGQRRAGRHDLIAHAQTRRFFVDLNRSPVSAKFDNFADKLLLSYFYDVVHFDVRHVFRHDKRTGYFYD